MSVVNIDGDCAVVGKIALDDYFFPTLNIGYLAGYRPI
jgi:hypothetical protein